MKTHQAQQKPPQQKQTAPQQSLPPQILEKIGKCIPNSNTRSNFGLADKRTNQISKRIYTIGDIVPLTQQEVEQLTTSSLGRLKDKYKDNKIWEWTDRRNKNPEKQKIQIFNMWFVYRELMDYKEELTSSRVYCFHKSILKLFIQDHRAMIRATEYMLRFLWNKIIPCIYNYEPSFVSFSKESKSKSIATFYKFEDNQFSEIRKAPVVNCKKDDVLLVENMIILLFVKRSNIVIEKI